MKITFVNHASVVLETGDIKLITDPWIEGYVFHDSWAHLAPTKFEYSDFASITHIWFSHEHPDHFSPPNLRKIPEDVRRQITVVYRETADGKVVEYCRKLGFRVVEIGVDNWTAIDDSVSLFVSPCHDDSALIIRDNEVTLVNTNDCLLDSTQMNRLSKLAGENVDVLLTQFSYASYVGETYEERQDHAMRKLRQIDEQVEHFAPKHVIPFASFVYFCHEENFYMNDAVNGVDLVHEHINHGPSSSVVLYPGDEWFVGSNHDSTEAICRYTHHARDVSPRVNTAHKSEDELMAAASTFHVRLREKLAYLPLLRSVGYVTPMSIFVTDLESGFQLSLDGLTKLAGAQSNECDISMSADTLIFCLKHDYGFNTTSVSGRYHVITGRGRKAFDHFMSLGDAMNHGRYSWKDLVAGACRRLRRIALGGLN